MWTRIRSRVVGTLRRRRAEREAADELQFHLDAATRWHEQRGLSETEARRTAVRDLGGGLTAQLEAIRDVRTPAWEATRADTRLAGRMITRTFGSTIAALACLGVSLGASVMIVTFVKCALLRALPWPDGERLVRVGEVPLADVQGPGLTAWSTMQDWQRDVQDAAALTGLQRTRVMLSDGPSAERLSGSQVTSSFFTVLGVNPGRGRALSSADTRPSAAPVVVLSDALWQRRYNADPDVIGTDVSVDGRMHTIVGVMSSALSHIALRGSVIGDTDLWLPLTAPLEARDDRQLVVLARLAPGQDRSVFEQRLRAVSAQVAATHPATNADWTARVERLDARFSATTRMMLIMASGAVVCLLLLASANIAGLTLTHGIARQHEWATRLALGATRARLLRQVVVERLLVGVLSVPVILLVAHAGRALFLRWVAAPELVGQFPIDGFVLVMAIGLALITSLVTGVGPATLILSRTSHRGLGMTARTDGVAGPPSTRLRGALVICDVSLSVLLLIGAALFSQSFLQLLGTDGGVDTRSIVVAHLEVARDGIPDDRVASPILDVVARLDADPRIRNVAAATLTPLRGSGRRIDVVTDDALPETGAKPMWLAGVTAGFFGLLDLRPEQGRVLVDGDMRTSDAAAVINQTMALRLCPAQPSCVGRRFRAGGDTSTWFTVVGVVRDLSNWDVSGVSVPTAYVPYGQSPSPEVRLLVRQAGDVGDTIAALRETVAAVAPSAVVFGAQPLAEVHRAALARQETLAALFVGHGGLALGLGAIGVYGVLSSLVAHRTYELGVRAALGAAPGRLTRGVLWQGLRLVIVGLGIGVLGGLAMARLARAQLYDVNRLVPPIPGVTSLRSAPWAWSHWSPSSFLRDGPPWSTRSSPFAG